MLIVVTGSRTWPKLQVVGQALDACMNTARQRKEFLFIRVGDARGVDKFVKSWSDADVRSKYVDCTVFEAKWHDPCIPGRCKGKPGAHRRPDPRGDICPLQGYVRNEKMVDDLPRPDYLLAFIHNESRGTTQCYEYAESKGIDTTPFRM